MLGRRDGRTCDRRVACRLSARSQPDGHRDLAPEQQFWRNGDARSEPERAQLSHVLSRWPHAHRHATIQYSEYAHRDPPSDYQTQIHNESYFGQATFDLYNQLYLTAALRDDGSTTFGRNNRRSLFPKASAAWSFTNMYKPSFLTFGKVRLSYGEAGQEPQPYLTSPTYSGTNLVGGIAQGTGFTPTQSGLGGLFTNFTKPASTLHPERTKELEGGFDVGFWGEKADLSATWYRSKRRT